MAETRRNWRDEVIPPEEMITDDIRAELRHDLSTYERVAHPLSKAGLAHRIEVLVEEMDKRTRGECTCNVDNGYPCDVHPEEETGGEVTDTYDSRPETKEHIRRVGQFIDRAIGDLGYRKAMHDQSKLVSPELEAFDEATPKLANLEYGSEEYKQALRDLGPALQHHYEHNDHHPEHYENGVQGMSLMVLIEMVCDWCAASERVKQRTDDPAKVKTFEAGLAHNQQRFGYSDELARIILNTARELGMVD